MIRLMTALVLGFGLTSLAQAQDSPMVRLLKGGQVPEERQGTIVEMIGARGSAADLTYLYERTLEPEGFSKAVRLQAFEALAEAARNRRVRPEGDLEAVGALIRDEEADLDARRAAVRLAGTWRLEALGADLLTLARDAEAPRPLRASALEALATIGGQAGREAILSLVEPGQAPELRALAVSALARLDVETAAERAVEVLRAEQLEQAAVDPLLEGFLNQQDGPDALALAIEGAEIPEDAAKLVLRSMYARGRTDPALVRTLSAAANLQAEVEPWSEGEMNEFLADVQTQGDPERGEEIFRRADLNCMGCHALSGAGGGVGPDLSAIGSSSPVDYLINSILLPDQAIKEEFETLVVLTLDGQIYQGVVADRDGNRLVLREATGERRVIPIEEIEDSKQGGSLMPQGLVHFMTRDEMVDLVRFLSELGKPGPYAIPTTPTIQRWRVLTEAPDAGADADSFPAQDLEAESGLWSPFYAKVAGDVPLDELAERVEGSLLYLRGEVDVSVGGRVAFRFDSTEGLRAWINVDEVPVAETIEADLERGRHRLTLAIDPAARARPSVRVEVVRPSGSSAEFNVVGGH